MRLDNEQSSRREDYMKEDSIFEGSKAELVDVTTTEYKFTDLLRSDKYAKHTEPSKGNKGHKSAEKLLDPAKELGATQSEIIKMPRNQHESLDHIGNKNLDTYVINRYSIPKRFV